MDKLVFGIGVSIFASIISALSYGWMTLLNFPPSWLDTMLIVQIIALIFVSFLEVGASATNGAGGWMLFAFGTLNFICGLILGVLKVLMIFWGWF